MNTRSLVLSSFIALALTLGMFYVGSRISFGAKSVLEQDQRPFLQETVNKLNDARVVRGMRGLNGDEELQEWLDGRMTLFIDGEREVDIDGMLAELPERLPTITSAAARTIVAKSTDELISQLEYWADGYSPEVSIVATRLYNANRGRTGCVLVAAKKVPKFDLSLLNEGITEFYNICRHCEEPHLGTLSKVNLALAVSCPHCRQTYDLLAADMLGRYHRATDFLEGMRPPPGASSDASGRFEEMVALWSSAVERCRYTVDLSGSKGEKDTWQRPSETFNFRNGDCEDSSLMLADWLLSRGFNARVAIGQALGQGGHAWVVVRLDGHQYLLETTIAEVPQTPPEPEVVKDRYRPQYLFDREALYFPEGPLQDVADYFSPEKWRALIYPRQGLGSIASDSLGSP